MVQRAYGGLAAAQKGFMKAAHAMHGGKLFPERQSREAAEDKMLQRWIAYLVCFLEQGRGMFLRAFRKLIDRAVLSPGQPVGQPLSETDPVQLFSIRKGRNRPFGRNAAHGGLQADEIIDHMHHRGDDTGEIGNLDEIDDQVLLTIMLAKIGRDIRRCCGQDDGHLAVAVILNGSGRRQRIKMFVISAAVYVEYTAESFDIVLESKLINCT